MLSFPKSTEYNKRIPKQNFYKNLTLSAALKRAMVEQINTIYWRNKISADTLPVEKGESVTELEVFEIKLNQLSLDPEIIRLMDREIPYHILFLLTYNGQCQAWIGYKEKSLTKENTFKVNSYYHSPWLPSDELDFTLDGLTMDAIYDHLVRQIAGKRLEGGSLKEAVERDKKRQKLQNQITTWQKKVDNERQFNKRVVLNDELTKLKQELEEL